jgi:hypothetical protein
VAAQIAQRVAGVAILERQFGAIRRMPTR